MVERVDIMIPVFRPNIEEDDIDGVVSVLRSGWLGLGPKTSTFETEFSKYIGTQFTVGLNSCTASLDLALKILGITEGDEVIVPTMTFVSTSHVVLYSGAKVVFADVDPVTLNVDVNDIAGKINDRTKVIIPVHYSGRPIDMDGLQSCINNRHIFIIEDAAHASGSVYKNQKCGSMGTFGCFSFHAVKPMAAGDGGALTMNDKFDYAKANHLRWMGIDKSTWDRTGKSTYSWDYSVDEVGYKYHMNDISASLALTQLTKLDRGIEIRRELVLYYRELLADVTEVTMPPMDEYPLKSAWHLLCVQCDKRNELVNYLKNSGIATGVHYKPAHLFNCYGEQPSLPNAEKAYLRILTLPLFTKLSHDIIKNIVDLIKSFYANSKS